MDLYEELILKVLKDGKPKEFHQLMDEADFSHNTLRLHLNNLVAKRLVTRQKTRSSSLGRPKFTYTMTQRPERGSASVFAGSSEAVVIPFRRLRRLCRFQRGGTCRETKDTCEAENCPQIQKEE